MAQRQGQNRPPQPDQPARPDPRQNALVAVNEAIEQRMAIISASAAAGVDPERFKYVALTVLTRNPRLLQCTPVSIARAIVESAQLGLEIGTGALPGAYLVPYWNRDLRQEEAQLIPSYKGLIDLARRSGQIRKVEARVVRAGDRFEYWYGLHPDLIHVPLMATERGPLEYVYAIAWLKDGDPTFDVMPRSEVELIRRRSRAADDGPWVTDYDAMALKTVLRRLCKLLPLTKDARDVLEREDVAEATAAPAPDAAAPGRTAQLRQALQVQLLGEGAATAEAAGQAAAVATEQVLPREDFVGTREVKAQICGATSPEGTTTCGLLPGHPGAHADLPDQPTELWPAV